MVRWLPWKRGPNYEYELPRLAAEIRELKLRDISATTRHRRWPSAFVQHSLSVIVLYAAYALLFASQKRKHLTILAFAPFALIFGYKLISRATLWQKTRIQSSLKLVEERRQTLVSAYKKQVKYDELMSLIGEDSTTTKKNPAKSDEKSLKKSDSLPKSSPGKVSPEKPHQTAAYSSVDGPVPVYQTTWMDRVLDLVIGVNENSPAFRYALICPYCRAHNGLAPFGKLAEEVSYVCRVCNRLVESVSKAEESGKLNESRELVGGVQEVEKVQGVEKVQEVGNVEDVEGVQEVGKVEDVQETENVEEEVGTQKNLMKKLELQKSPKGKSKLSKRTQ